MRDNTAKRKLAAGQAVSVVNPDLHLAGAGGAARPDGLRRDLPRLRARAGELGRGGGHGPRRRAGRRHADRAGPGQRSLDDHPGPRPRRRRGPGPPRQHPGRGRGRGPSRQVRADRPPRLSPAGAPPSARRWPTTPAGRTRRTMVVVMLEEVEALANLDDVLKVEHVDVFFVAPGDLAQSMGLPRADGPPEGPGGDRRRGSPHRRGGACRRRPGDPGDGPPLPGARRALPLRRAGQRAGPGGKGLQRAPQSGRPETRGRRGHGVHRNDPARPGDGRGARDVRARAGPLRLRPEPHQAVQPPARGLGRLGDAAVDSSATTWTRAATSW